MKKILFTIVLLLMPISVFAKNYNYVYSDNYYIEGENDSLYAYKSDNSMLFLSDEFDERPNDKPNRQIFEIKYNVYKKLKRIKRVIISNIYLCAKFYEIEIYDGDTLINYTFNEEDSIFSLLNDNDKTGSYVKMLNGKIDIILPDDVDVENIKIILYLQRYGDATSVSYYTRLFSNDYVLPYDINNHTFNKNNEYIVRGKSIKFSNNDIISDVIIPTKDNVVNKIYEDEEIVSTFEYDDNFYDKIGEIIKYKYTDVLFKYYRIESTEEIVVKNREIKNTSKSSTLKELSTKKVNNSNYNDLSIKKVNKKVSNNIVLKDSVSLVDVSNKVIKLSKKNDSNVLKIDKKLSLVICIILLLLSLLGYILISLIKER